MKDYRLPENRHEYFTALYKMNLERGVMPGLVYLYLPELARRYSWNAEQKLWFAFLNGLTQNPITSLRLFDQLPMVPPAGAMLTKFEEWFNAAWDTLQFDTDRRYQKKDTLPAIKAYAALVEEFGSQEAMLTGKPYSELWDIVRNRYYSFGRLSSFSYLEYVYLNGFGADCDDLMFSDKSGSKSHRNGMLFLRGSDELVWDKRLPNGQDGNYKNLKLMSGFLATEADAFLEGFTTSNPGVSNAGRFTMESNLCTFKNHFFGRRYPGVYADMAQERIEWAEARDQSEYADVFKDMRAELLPDWLRAECDDDRFTVKTNGAVFPETGAPFRAEHFL